MSCGGTLTAGLMTRRNPVCLLLLLLLGGALTAQTVDSRVQMHKDAAAAALKTGDLSRAQQEYRTIIKIDPGNVDAYAALGVTLYSSGKFAEAAGSLQTALSLDPSQSRVKLFLALTQAELGQCAEAVPALRDQLDRQSDARLRRLAGLAALDCQISSTDLTSALLTTQQLKTLFPDDPDVLYKSAELYTRLWNQTAGELMQKHPESFRVHQLAGEVYEAQGKGEQAMREYSLALKENGRIAGLHYRIGQLLLQQGEANSEERALAEFQQELAINPESAIAEYSIGEFYRHRQDFQQANQHLRHAVELDTNLAEAHIALAQVFMAEHDVDRSRQESEIAVREQPDNPAAHYALMLAYRGQGKTEEANRELSLFQHLQEEQRRNFDNKLSTLLTGKRAAGLVAE
jgi:tetratricopeptide (TPR) repeat protein